MASVFALSVVEHTGNTGFRMRTVLPDGPAWLKTDDPTDPGAAEFERTRYKNAFLRRKKLPKERSQTPNDDCDTSKGMTSCNDMCPPGQTATVSCYTQKAAKMLDVPTVCLCKQPSGGELRRLEQPAEQRAKAPAAAAAAATATARAPSAFVTLM
jgi:hypothetical protein